MIKAAAATLAKSSKAFASLTKSRVSTRHSGLKDIFSGYNASLYSKAKMPFSSLEVSYDSSPEYVTVTFIDKDQTPVEVRAKVGSHLVSVAHANGIDIEGRCEASMVCCTCHVIFEPEFYNRIPKPKEEEEDLLDLMNGLTETSRLGCQVYVTKEFEGAKIKLPPRHRPRKAAGSIYVEGVKTAK